MSSDVDYEGLPELAADANKYTRGRLVVMAGSSRYPGAAVLAARAGQRTGAGYTQVVTAKRAVDLALAASPSLVAQPFSSWDASDLPETKPARPCAVCLGPGFVADDEATRSRVIDVLKNARCPVLVDGGALSYLTSKKAMKQLVKRARKGRATVLTPHGGEAARLARPLALKAEGEQLAAGLALAYHAVVVLKGPDTFISDGKRSSVMTEGGPELAKAGTGDVLAGMISSLLAQGAEPFDAALLGSTLHARAAREASARYSMRSVIPEDIIECICSLA